MSELSEPFEPLEPSVQRRVVVLEGPDGGCRVTAHRAVRPGDRLDLGREGDLPTGLANSSISRVAVTATATEHGWDLRIGNRNGAVVHPWAQAPELAAPATSTAWPLLALRLLPDSPTSRHWILFEAADLPVTPAGPGPTRTTRTDRAARPGELPAGEREALHTVFGGLLAWPPQVAAEPLLLKQAAGRLGISISAVQARLDSARGRARRLGLAHDVGLTDPTYLYLLVRAGYLDPPGDRTHRPPPS